MSNKIPTKKRSRKFPPTEVYSEASMWECENLNTGFCTKINGVLAQILKKYPRDYCLTFVSAEGA